MERIKRAERLGAIAHILTTTPNRIHGFSEFCEMFGAAKSPISADIEILSKSFARFTDGEVETLAGAAGGVRYRIKPRPERVKATLDMLCERLSESGRMLPGGFLYTSDITTESDTTMAIAELIASTYYDAAPDIVLTMETKGIPIATEVARMMNVPLVIARRDSRAYEGSAVKINYIAGNGVELETMALARRAVKPGQKALIVDDFMKAGGTLRGMSDLMHEFQVDVAGIAVLISASKEAAEKLNVKSILSLEGFDETNNRVIVRSTGHFE